MAFYHTCPYSGAHLDPGEPCDCTERAQRLQPKTIQQHARDQTHRAGAVRRLVVGELASGSASRAALPRR